MLTGEKIVLYSVEEALDIYNNKFPHHKYNDEEKLYFIPFDVFGETLYVVKKEGKSENGFTDVMDNEEQDIIWKVPNYFIKKRIKEG